LFIISFGTGKLVIYGSMRLDSYTHEMNSQVINLKGNNLSISTGKAILNSLKSLSRKIKGKEPVYITDDGYQINIDSIGNEKSINVIKNF
jgi:hypothetical protein